MLMAIHGARLPTRAIKRVERYAIEVAHASPAGSTSSSTTRTAPSSCSSVRSAGAVELFDLFDQADADPVASTAALVEQLASLEQRLSLLEAKFTQVASLGIGETGFRDSRDFLIAVRAGLVFLMTIVGGVGFLIFSNIARRN